MSEQFGSAEDWLEDMEAEQETRPQSAVDPETGEINWDCPCLASALKPPCGGFFRVAFECFVKSQSEPKGSECVDAFREMSDCIRAHPETYGEPEEEQMLESDGKTLTARDGQLEWI